MLMKKKLNSGGSAGGKKPFKYTPRDPKAVAKRAAGDGQWDRPIKSGIPLFAPKAGEHTIRYLPAAWDGAEHYGTDIFMHYSVGPENQKYLCRKKMLQEECAICDEYEKAVAADDKEYMRATRSVQRVAAYVIDRNNEAAGPQLWLQPYTVDRDVSKLSINKKTKATINIEDPEDGYDVDFEIKGSKDRTEYLAFSVAREATPLSDSPKKAARWLEYISENPIPDQVQFYDADYIAKVFGGAAAPGADEEDEDEGGTRAERKAKAGKAAGKRAAVAEEDDEDEEEEEEAPPVKRKKGKPVDDEDEDLDEADADEEEDDEEEEVPAPKRKKGKPAPAEDDDEEEEEDDEEDDEEEETPAPRKKKQQAPPADEDEEDDDEEEEDDDEEEEEPAPKKKRKPAPVADDDDEADEEADDEEDEEEDERPVKKKARPAVAEDEEEEDEPEDDEEEAPSKLRSKIRAGMKK